MKLRLLMCTVLLALFAAPAFADSLSFTNKGGLSSVGGGGVSANSTMDSFSVNGMQILFGDIGFVNFDTGMLTGSLNNGTFSGGDFSFGLSGSAAIFVNNFTGTLSKLGDDLYDLVGTFSGVANGVAFNGTTNQIFSFSGDDDNGRHGDDDCWKDLHGTTTLTATAVPEPSTLTFLGTGLIALAGAVRRKLAARV